MTAPRRQTSTDRPRLSALLDGRVVGEVFQDARGRYRFVYEDAWLAGDEGHPLSLSMPTTTAEHGHEAVQAFLWGLLPDNERTLERYGRTFGVSARNPLALLAHIGADCAGAVQFVRPEDVSEYEGEPTPSKVEWIDDAEIATELRTARETGLPGTTRRTAGRFSLAGAQPKIALFHSKGRWGRPMGRTPTTHILKPPTGEYWGFAENEHLCLSLAAELGLGPVRTSVRSFAGESAIVVERYARVADGRRYRRIHQEDLCQAMAVLPWSKYESDGGLGVASSIALLRESSLEPETDVGRFVDMLVLNWVIAATDAHAKNYSLLHAAGGSVRLGPFYDVVSYLPYADKRLSGVRLAMRVGMEYVVHKIARADWVKLAKAAKLSERFVMERLDGLLPLVAPAIERVAARTIEEGLDRAVVEPLAMRIAERSRECRERLAAGTAARMAKG